MLDDSGVYTEVVSTTLVNDGEWHPVMGVIERKDWSIYVDCTLENTKTTFTPFPVFSNLEQLFANGKNN